MLDFFRKTVLAGGISCLSAPEPYLDSDNAIKHVHNIIWINWKIAFNRKLNCCQEKTLKTYVKLYVINRNSLMQEWKTGT
jgi:hypothetical protein